LATLKSTERVLKRDPSWASKYNDQIEDMVSRGVARILNGEEIASWNGPRFYLSHLAVSNPKSASTPVRIVFNSSQVYKGYSLNSFLAKGPDSYLNNLVGFLLRWRENYIAVAGDIRKMYNSIHIEEMEQHCHRFLWRNLEDREPDIYVIPRVNMGDKPAGAISTEALYLTADIVTSTHPNVAQLIRTSTYVDDIVTSLESTDAAEQLIGDTDNVLQTASFEVKSWTIGSVEETEVKLLGLHWNTTEGIITFRSIINFFKKITGVFTQPNLIANQIP